MTAAAKFHYVLRLADTSLVLGQRLGEWVGHAPALEEDLALANIALDLIGQARLLLTYAGEIEGRGRDEDALAFLRDAPEFCNVSLAEQPNGDFGHTIVRQFLLDAWQLELYEALAASTDARLAEIAAKAVKETRYHVRFSAGWLVRLGDGTAESHARVAAGARRRSGASPTSCSRPMRSMRKWPRPASRHPWPSSSPMGGAGRRRYWRRPLCKRPAAASYLWHGKRGVHTEHLGHMLAEMQHLPRTFPGVTW